MWSPPDCSRDLFRSKELRPFENEPILWAYCLNPTAFRKAKITYNFGLSECSRVKQPIFVLAQGDPLTLKAPNKNCSRQHFNF